MSTLKCLQTHHYLIAWNAKKKSVISFLMCMLPLDPISKPRAKELVTGTVNWRGRSRSKVKVSSLNLRDGDSLVVMADSGGCQEETGICWKRDFDRALPEMVADAGGGNVEDDLNGCWPWRGWSGLKGADGSVDYLEWDEIGLKRERGESCMCAKK